MWGNLPPGHDVWSNAPGLPGGMVMLGTDYDVS